MWCCEWWYRVMMDSCGILGIRCVVLDADAYIHMVEFNCIHDGLQWKSFILCFQRSTEHGHTDEEHHTGPKAVNNKRVETGEDCLCGHCRLCAVLVTLRLCYSHRLGRVATDIFLFFAEIQYREFPIVLWRCVAQLTNCFLLFFTVRQTSLHQFVNELKLSSKRWKLSVRLRNRFNAWYSKKAQVSSCCLNPIFKPSGTKTTLL